MNSFYAALSKEREEKARKGGNGGGGRLGKNELKASITAVGEKEIGLSSSSLRSSSASLFLSLTLSRASVMRELWVNRRKVRSRVRKASARSSCYLVCGERREGG